MNGVSSKDLPQVVVLGLDGATFDIIDPLIQEGRLPNLARLMRQGTRSVLESTIPCNSSVAWVTFATGVNAGKHGIFFFNGRREGTYERPVINASRIKSRTVWDILAASRMGSVVVNLPVTYPPHDVPNTIIVGGLLTPDEESVFTHPPEIHTELLAALGDYPLDNVAITGAALDPDRIKNLERFFRHECLRNEAALLLSSRYPREVLCVVLSALDRIQHVGFRFLDPDYSSRHPQESQKFRALMEHTYELVDRLVGDVVSRLPETTNYIIMSDHGFGPIRKRIYLNRWLRQQGYLHLLRDGKSTRRRLYRTSLDRVLNRVAGNGATSALPRALGKLPLWGLETRKLPLWERVDWERTTAYVPFAGGEETILINLKGREPHGIVESGQAYENLRTQIIGKLAGIRDPDTGEQVITEVWRREELFHGNSLDEGPDIQYRTLETAYLPRGDLDGGDTILETPENAGPAMHRVDGTLILHGPAFHSGKRLDGAHIMDIAPTMLHLLGLPVRSYMDGKVLEEALLDEWRENRPVRFVDEPYQRDRAPETPFDKNEEARVKDTLRGLGYMD